MKPVSGIPYWPSRDPVGEKGGLNLYAFVINRPNCFIDAFGLAVTVIDGITHSTGDGEDRSCVAEVVIGHGTIVTNNGSQWRPENHPVSNTIHYYAKYYASGVGAICYIGCNANSLILLS